MHWIRSGLFPCPDIGSLGLGIRMHVSLVGLGAQFTKKKREGQINWYALVSV
jgi:hypothetical protein